MHLPLARCCMWCSCMYSLVLPANIKLLYNLVEIPLAPPTVATVTGGPISQTTIFPTRQSGGTLRLSRHQTVQLGGFGNQRGISGLGLEPIRCASFGVAQLAEYTVVGVCSFEAQKRLFSSYANEHIPVCRRTSLLPAASRSRVSATFLPSLAHSRDICVLHRRMKARPPKRTS